MTRAAINRGVLLAAAFLVANSGAWATEAPAAVDPAHEAYARPGTLARLPDGRNIHLRCEGRGSPTVILTAGLGDWSNAWRHIQPRIATLTRTCAWDRAGAGFSSGSDLPQTIERTTADLWAALRSESIAGPYVLVGHSYGGLESIAFADRHPDQVTGMVLVDPSLPDGDRLARQAAPAFAAYLDTLIAPWVQQVGVCREALIAQQPATATPEACRGLDAPPGYPDALSEALAQLDLDPSRWAAKASLMGSFSANVTAMAKPDRRLGSMPLVVLSATSLDDLPPDAPEAVRKQIPDQLRMWHAEHQRLAGLSTRGSHQLVPGATHYIHQQKPDVVTFAIEEVVMQLRSLD